MLLFILYSVSLGYAFIFSLCPLCLCDENAFAFPGGNIPYSRHASAKTKTRQLSRPFSPLLCHIGGASPASRRILCHKILIAAPSSRLSAVHIGGSFLNFINLNKTCNFGFSELFSLHFP
jgi:hypothetical protein